MQKTKQTGMQGGRALSKLCEIKCQSAADNRAYGGEQFLFGCSLTKELARLPRSLSTHTDGFHDIPTGWEGGCVSGRGPCFHTPLREENFEGPWKVGNSRCFSRQGGVHLEEGALQ